MKRNDAEKICRGFVDGYLNQEIFSAAVQYNLDIVKLEDTTVAIMVEDPYFQTQLDNEISKDNPNPKDKTIEEDKLSKIGRKALKKAIKEIQANKSKEQKLEEQIKELAGRSKANRELLASSKELAAEGAELTLDLLSRNPQAAAIIVPLRPILQVGLTVVYTKLLTETKAYTVLKKLNEGPQRTM